MGSPVSDCQFPGLPILLLGSFQGRELQELTPASREALGGDGACWPDCPQPRVRYSWCCGDVSHSHIGRSACLSHGPAEHIIDMGTP